MTRSQAVRGAFLGLFSVMAFDSHVIQIAFMVTAVVAVVVVEIAIWGDAVE